MIVKDGSRFVIVCLKGKNAISLCLLIAVCTEKIKRELYFIGLSDECGINSHNKTLKMRERM